MLALPSSTVTGTLLPFGSVTITVPFSLSPVTGSVSVMFSVVSPRVVFVIFAVILDSRPTMSTVPILS